MRIATGSDSAARLLSSKFIWPQAAQATSTENPNLNDLHLATKLKRWEELESLISQLETSLPEDLKQIISSHVQGRRRYGITDQDFGLMGLRSQNFNRDWFRWGNCDKWFGKVPGFEHEFGINLDCPQAVALTYQGYPIALIAFDRCSLDPKKILVKQIQGVNKYSKCPYDETNILKNPLLQNGINKFRELMLKILMNLARKASYSKIEVQSYTHRFFINPEIAYCGDELPKNYPAARRLGFRRNLLNTNLFKRL